jgi:hypothetical protein
MQHLDSERLAAFDHHAFTPEEHAHLAACTVCRHEVQAYALLVQMAGAVATREATEPRHRLVSWEAVADGLQQASTPDRLPAAPPRAAARTPGVSSPWWSRSSRRAAAAVVLMAGGAALGRVTSGTPLLFADRPASAAAVLAESLGMGDVSLRPATDGGAGEFASVDQATGILKRAQRDYERASLWLAANDSTPHDPAVYRARLAALDQMMAASRAALRDAPQDPVLNQYYLAAFSAREATLQQLGTSLPVGTTIERY